MNRTLTTAVVASTLVLLVGPACSGKASNDATPAAGSLVNTVPATSTIKPATIDPATVQPAPTAPTATPQATVNVDDTALQKVDPQGAKKIAPAQPTTPTVQPIDASAGARFGLRRRDGRRIVRLA